MSRRKPVDSQRPQNDRQLLYAALVLGSLVVVVTCGTGTLPSAQPSAPPPQDPVSVPTSVSELFSTHPATEKRIAALQAMSGTPGPSPARRSALDPNRSR